MVIDGISYHISIRHRAPLSWDGKGLRSFRWRTEMKSCEHKCNIGASITRIGFRAPFYHIFIMRKTPKNPILTIKAPMVSCSASA